MSVISLHDQVNLTLFVFIFISLLFIFLQFSFPVNIFLFFHSVVPRFSLLHLLSTSPLNKIVFFFYFLLISTFTLFHHVIFAYIFFVTFIRRFPFPNFLCQYFFSSVHPILNLSAIFMSFASFLSHDRPCIFALSLHYIACVCTYMYVWISSFL